MNVKLVQELADEKGYKVAQFTESAEVDGDICVMQLFTNDDEVFWKILDWVDDDLCPDGCYLSVAEVGSVSAEEFETWIRHKMATMPRGR